MKPDEELMFLCAWDAEQKEKTWSGTPWSLLTALRRHMAVRDVNVEETVTLPRRIASRLWYRGKNEFHVPQIRSLRPRLNELCRGRAVFQFTEYVDTPEADTYIYIDLNVQYLHDVWQSRSPLYEYTGFGRFSPRRLRQRLRSQTAYFRHAKGVFCMGEWLARYLTEECGVPAEKVHAVGGGADLPVIDGAGRQGNKILFVGRDYKRKGLGITVEAFRRLRERLPRAELYVAGPQTDPYPGGMEGYRFLGDLPRAELARYFALCDIFCMPSYFEAYGLVFIEALSAGLPCIGRRCQEMPYFIDDGQTGLLLESDDAASLAAMMERLLTQEQFRRNVLARASDYRSRYTWDAVAGRICRVLRENARQ